MFRKEVLKYVPLSLLILIVINLFISLIRYPLSRQAVYREMESKNVVASLEEQGAWVYVVKNDYSGFVCYVFSEDFFLSRFRRSLQFEYSVTINTVIEGKRHIVVLMLDEENIQLIHTENTHIRPIQVLGFFMVLLGVPRLIEKFREE